ncbi:MAG TPA: choice-of-anchor D domain-containing protein [Ktedonobacteraceae bacterium]|nr:choice-of-anchor D domain-containing protein [Ktedonobacteraceae bacterium]
MKQKLTSAFKKEFSAILAAMLLLGMITGGLPYAAVHASTFSSLKNSTATQNPIQIENNLPGTTGWNDFAADSAPATLSGFGSKISVNHGESLDLYVTTTAPSFTIDIFRTGYYQGLGARLITSLGSFPGLHQAIPNPDPVTGMVSCTGWTKTTTLTIPSTWVTGIYLAKLTSSTGFSSFILFVVRDDGGNEDVMFQTSVTTSQAYNTWGGTSLYNNDLTNKSLYPYPHATKVSFDRPFNPGDSNGAGHYFFFEYYFVYWMESQGYNVAYTTNIDTDARPAELLKHKAFLSVGHDEYWSMGMRNAVQSAISAGVNVAFFSANTAYWQIRLEANSAGVADRVQVGYKDFATASSAPGPDPQYGVNNSIVTSNWRDPFVNQPENGLLGVMYEQQEDKDYAYVVANASNWIYAGTGFKDGTSIPGIVGYEYDKVFNNGATPPNLTVLSSSPVHGYNGGFNSFSNSTLYTAPSGARVFASGTIQWSLGLASIQGNTYTNAGIQQTTANILNNFIGASSAPNSGITTSSGTLSFGNAALNAAAPAQTVTFTNTNASAITINSLAVTGTNASDFTQTNTCGSSLAANASCTATVNFKPTAANWRSANLTLTDNASVGTQEVVLSGMGITSGAVVNLSTTSLNFGNQTVKTTSAPQTITLTNTGSAALSISMVQIQGYTANDFAQSNTCGSSVAAGASCTIKVTFTPGALSTRSGSIVITDNSADSPQSVVLSGTGVSAVPSVTLTPNSLDFGTETEGVTSAPQTVTLTNSTTSAVTFSNFALTGTNASDFAQSNTCPTGTNTLAVNASCTISVTFTPQSGSQTARSASVSITDSAPNSPQTLALSGTDVPKVVGVNLNPTSLNFGTLNTGSPSKAQTITLTNNNNATLNISSIAVTGTNASDFTQTNTCGTSVANNATCTISVIFTPSATGSRSASVAITDDGPNSPQTVALSGAGAPPPTIYFSDGFETGDFSQWSNGSSGTGSATVESTVVNNGTSAAQLTNTSGQTSQISTALSGLPALTYTRFYFRFSSLSTTALIALGQDSGGHNQWIMYYDSGRQGLDIYFWNGAGTRYDVYSSTNILSANTWYAIEVETNQATSGHGEVWVNGTSIGSFNGDLTQTNSYGKLTLNNDATGTDYFDDVAVANNFTIPIISTSVRLSPRSLSFGSQVMNIASKSLSTTLTNIGTSPLTISGLSVTGTNASDFTQTNNCPTSLAASATCTINVTFTPSKTGAESASVTLVDSSPDSPQTLALTGTGVAASPIVSLNPTSLSFGNQNVTTTSTAQTVTLSNTGNASLSISGISVTGSNASDFAQTNSCPASLAANANCTISVTFTPSSTNARSANLSITDNASGSPQTVALSGTGTGIVPPPTASFSDGFESGSFSQWTGGTNGTGTATVQNTVVHTGTYAAQLANASGQYAQVATTVNGIPSTNYTRFYFRFSSLSTSTLIALAQDSGGHNQWIIYYDSGRQGLDIYFWNGAGKRYDIYTNTNVLSANTWYSIEVEMNQATSGHGEVWLNGTSVGAFDGDMTETNSYAKLILDNEATGTDYFDDVVISNGYNGK